MTIIKINYRKANLYKNDSKLEMTGPPGKSLFLQMELFNYILKFKSIQHPFFKNSSVLAVSVPLFVRINHKSGQTICGLAWNPKGNKELAYTDNQVNFYLNQSSSLSRHNLLDDCGCTTVCPWKC